MNSRDVPGHLSESSFPAIRIGGDGAIRHTSRASQKEKIIFNKAECFIDDKQYEISDEMAMLSPARARGFSLSEKAWAFFLVDQVKPIEFSLRAFQSLAMDSYYKDMIQALVEAHDTKTEDFDDIVVGKGKGVIISLEGPPGSGKTLTAGWFPYEISELNSCSLCGLESMAELTHRPLYAISTSELGTVAKQAEKGLQDIFRRAEKWDAVVLLDEADLFLTRRTNKELDRNALVTVFLRTIEYFQGIMFLTSNRVEHFDPAFKSRIHLRVPFKNPTADTRALIWKTFLPRDWDAAIAQRLGLALQLNGREIKNLVRVSRLVSKFKQQQLSEEIIRSIAEHAIESDCASTV